MVNKKRIIGTLLAVILVLTNNTFLYALDDVYLDDGFTDTKVEGEDTTYFEFEDSLSFDEDIEKEREYDEYVPDIDGELYDGFSVEGFAPSTTDGIEDVQGELSLVSAASILITKQPEDVTILKDQGMRFEIEATGTDLTYQWQYQWSYETTRWINFGGAQTSVLTRTSVPESWDGLKVRCIVSDGSEKSEISEVAILTVMGEIILDHIIYDLVDGVMKVIGYEGDYSSYTVRTNVNGYTVSEIDEEAFMGNENITSISLPNTITIIRARAFKDCVNLSSMTSHD